MAEASQRYQAELIRYYIDAFRKRKYKPNKGFIHFVFNDGAPLISWSVLDSRGEKKLGFFALKKSASPLYCFFPYLRWGRFIVGRWFLANDTQKEKKVTVILEKEGKEEKSVFFQKTLFLPKDSLIALTPFRFYLSPCRLVGKILENGKVVFENTYTFGGSNGTA